MTESTEGGCNCGAVRYRLKEIFDVVYCHCRSRRKTTGAPVNLVVVVPREALELTRGTPACDARSGTGEVFYCADCRTRLYFAAKSSPYLTVSHGSLDAPEAIPPRAHQWVSSALPWLKIEDDLPRFADGQLSHPACR